MREIKFRAWDKLHGKMLTKIDVMHFGHTQTGSNAEQVYGYNPSKEATSDSKWVALDSLVLMQYTGLKDENGIEIYEGDLLAGILLRAEVVYRYGAFWIKDRIGTFINEENRYQLLYLKASNLKVIGNLHENPELQEKAAA